MPTTTISVRGMSCAHCVAAVEASLSALPGVGSARADLEDGRVTVVHDDRVGRAEIDAAIADAGYDVAD